MSIKLIILFSSLCFSMIPLVENLPRHDKYYAFYYKRFYNHFKNNLYDFKSNLNETELLSQFEKATHWKVSGQRNILWGVGLNTYGELTYHFRYPNGDGDIIEIQSDSQLRCQRSEKFLKCGQESLEIQSGQGNLKAIGFPLHPEGKFVFDDFVTETFSYRNDKGELTRIDYVLNDVQAEWLPAKLKKVVYHIGYDTRLPLDKISVHKNGGIIVFYP